LSLFIEPFARDLVKRLHGKELMNILEIASGTGRVSKQLLHFIHLEGHLISSDLNEDMKGYAQSKLSDPRII
jgi:ubiquinone/menaquinone biosynthesis C-methylase UbiE